MTTPNTDTHADTHAAIVQRYYDDVWSRGQLALVDTLMGEDYENCDPATPGGRVVGREAFKAFVAAYREAFPDLRMQIVEQHRDGDVVFSRWLASGTHRGALMGIPATGKSVAGIEGMTLSRFRGGRIVEDRVVWDVAGLLRVLGVLPT